MEINMDRFDVEPYQSIEFDELESLDNFLDRHSGTQNEIAPILDNEKANFDEHETDFGLYNIDVSGIVEEMWLDSASPMDFSIEVGYL